MQGGKVFFDTNVLIYSLDDTEPEKSAQATALIQKALTSGHGVISAQVAQETLNFLFRRNPTAVETIERVNASLLRRLYRVDTTAELIESAIDVKNRWRFSFYDALVIAGAMAAKCTTLYSEDLQHGQAIGSMKIVNPFAKLPSAKKKHAG